MGWSNTSLAPEAPAPAVETTAEGADSAAAQAEAVEEERESPEARGEPPRPGASRPRSGSGSARRAPREGRPTRRRPRHAALREGGGRRSGEGGGRRNASRRPMLHATEAPPNANIACATTASRIYTLRCDTHALATHTVTLLLLLLVPSSLVNTHASVPARTNLAARRRSKPHLQ